MVLSSESSPFRLQLSIRRSRRGAPLFVEMSLLQSTFSIWDNTPICSRNGTACAHSESLQCPIDNQQQQLQAVDLANTDEAFAMLGGTLVAALLVYAILPYVRARTSSSRRGQSKAQSPMSMDRRRRCSNQSGMLSTSTALNGAGRRVRQTLFGDDVGEVESAGGGRDGRRSKGGSRRRDVAGSATGSEPLLAILPAFNGTSSVDMWVAICRRYEIINLFCAFCRRTGLARVF